MLSSHDDVRSRFGIRFAMLARRWRRVLDRSLAEQGLTSTSWAPLVHLDEMGDGVNQKALAARMDMDAASLVRLLDILSRESLVERRTAETDKRARLVYLTPEGHQRVAHIRTILAKTEAEMLGDIDTPQIAQCLAVLEQIDARISVLHRQDIPDDLENSHD